MLTTAERLQLQTDVLATLSDVCNVTGVGAGEPVFDPDTGTYVSPNPEVIHAALPCRVAPWTATRVVQAGEEPVSLGAYHVTVPVSATGIDVDDIVIITASDDADLVGIQLRVTEAFLNSLGVQRRLACEVVL